MGRQWGEINCDVGRRGGVYEGLRQRIRDERLRKGKKD